MFQQDQNEWDKYTFQTLGGKRLSLLGLRRKYLRSSVSPDYQIPAHKQTQKV